MLVKVGIVLAAPLLVMALVLSATGVVVVDVREGGPDGHHLVIPVPLLLAQAALSFAPAEARYVECPEFAPYQDVAIRVLEELKDIPDAVLVEVEEGDETVIIRKEGRVLRILVQDGDDERVECTLPIRGAIRVVEAFDGRGFHTKAALRGIRAAPRGTLVHVEDGEDEVKIRIL